MTVWAAPQGEFYSGPNPRGAVALPNSPSVGEWKIPARSQTDVAPPPILPMSDTSHGVSRNRQPVGENHTRRPPYGAVVQLVRTPACHAVNGSSTLPRVTINKHQLRNNNLSFFPIFVPLDGKEPHADVVELADAADSKSVGSNTMRVQVPPSAPMRCITENGRASGTTI